MKPLLKIVLFPLLSLIFSFNKSSNLGFMSPQVYKVGRVFVFRASFFDSKDELISQEHVKLKIIGGQMESDRNQFKARWEYEVYPDLDTNLTIGITENSKFVFLHQPRYQKYLFTEICGFPSVHLPLYENLKWKSSIKIPDDSEVYGDYQGWTVKTKSTVIGVSYLDLLDRDALKTWEIRTNSRHNKGANFAVFNFNEEFGFVRLYFKHYDQTSLLMELININQ